MPLSGSWLIEVEAEESSEVPELFIVVTICPGYCQNKVSLKSCKSHRHCRTCLITLCDYPELFSFSNHISKHISVILHSPHQACPFTSFSVSAYLILVFLNTLGNPVNTGTGVSVAAVAGGAVGRLILILIVIIVVIDLGCFLCKHSGSVICS